jgi:hypothetical protein
MPTPVTVPRPLLFAMATVFGVSSTFQAYGLQRLEGKDASPQLLLPLLVLNLVYWYIPAFVAPTIMRVAMRYELSRTPWRVQALVHAVGALAYAFVHTTVVLVGC